MIKVDGIKIRAEQLQSAEPSLAVVRMEVAKKLAVAENAIQDLKLLKKSIDARKKPAHLQLSVCCKVAGEKKLLKRRGVSQYQAVTFDLPERKYSQDRPVVVGFGPAGIFAAYILALAGLKPLVFERGADVDTRSKDVAKFWQKGELNTASNVQFGEGGAGTFSDGKLSTNLRDKRNLFVLQTLVEHGAPAEIIYQAKPHVGTDILRKVVKNIRKKIIALGGEIHFNSLLEDIIVRKNQLHALVVNGQTVPCRQVFLALGHSARDSFDMLYQRHLEISPKPFAMGVRIEHPQAMINQVQYGSDVFGAADYKLAYHGSERSVYSFCMCPGGLVIAAASEAQRLVTNGMSLYKRREINANSALLVEVKTSDFGSQHPLAGVEFQRHYEQLAFELGGGNYYAPIQTVGGFLNSEIRALTAVKPSYQPGYQLVELDNCLPPFVSSYLREALPYFDNKIKGFAREDAVLTAIESRSSSPVRLLRTKDYQSNYQGIYPIGEGAGYAGGIMSAALDGIKSATAYLESL